MQKGFMYCNYTTMKSMHVSAIPWMFGPKGANESCVWVYSEIFLEGNISLVITNPEFVF